jgi:hypothetical protein
MAEFFTPSTTGEGQGGAQILSADFTPLNASGIVRGIERAEARMSANQQKEYERQKEEAKRKREQLNKLAELQYGGNNEFLRKISDEAFNDFKTAVIENGEDSDEAWLKTVQILNRVDSADKVVGKIAEDVRQMPNDFFTLTEEGWTPGSLSIFEMSQSGDLGNKNYIDAFTDFENEIQNFGRNPSNMIETKTSLEDIYLADRKKADEAKETTETLTNEGGIKTTEKSIPQNKKERRDAILANPIAIQSVLNRLRREYNVGTIEEVEKAIGMPFPQYFKQSVDNLFKREDVVNIKEELPKKEGGGKGITEQDLTIAKKVKEAVNILQDNPSIKESKEGLNTFLAPYNLIVKSYGDSTPIEIKDLGLSDGDIIFVDNDGKAKSAPLKANDADGIYRVIAKAAPDVKLEALGQIEFKDPTTQATSTPKELKDDITLLMEGDDNVLSKFEGVEVDRNTASPDILKVDDKTFDITNPKTAKEAFEYLEKRGYKKETTTREDLNAIEAERRDAPKVATEEDLNNLPD